MRRFSTGRTRLAQNLTEKIIQRYAVGAKKDVHSGDYVSIRPSHCMTHDNSWPVALKFKSLGASKISDNRQVVMTLDHDVQNHSEKNLAKYRNIQQFAKDQGVDFYPAGRGIGHQIMIEEGYAFPYNLTVASDSHSNTYGGIGCLGTPVVRTDAAAIWATGVTWWQIPPVARIHLQGSLPAGVSGKDVIVALCGLFNHDEVLNHALEFVGDGVSSLSIDERLTIANMTTEWGALTGLFPIDSTTLEWYQQRVHDLPQPHARINASRVDNLQIIQSDPDAYYAKELTLDLGSLSPCVSGPNSVKVSTPLSTLSEQKIKVNKAYLVSCTNSRLSDIEAAAAVVKDRHVAPGVQFYVAAASSQVQENAEHAGAWQTLLDAGAIPLPAGCGPCIGLGAGLLEPGEVGISATNRNFKGRMGSREALAYLASPELVAASAILGYIGSPEELVGKECPKTHEVVKSVKVNPPPTQSGSTEETDILPGFPEVIEGRLVFCDADNVNTDAIYPGKYTYQDDIPKAKMAEVCMENYDPNFRELTKPGDIIVSGFNFGTGSSREQAATAILAKGISMVVSGSFGNIFGRNAINNALLTLEIPALVQLLRETITDKSPTVPTNLMARWDVRNALFTVSDGSNVILKQKVGELGESMQEIIVAEGLEKWVSKKIQS